MRTGHNELAAKFGYLLLAQQRLVSAASADNIILGLKFHHRLLSSGNLVAQFLYPILQPNAGSLCCLVLGLQLVDDVGIGNRIRDLRGMFGIVGSEADLDHITQANALDVQSILKGLDRTPVNFELRGGLILIRSKCTKK